MLSSAEEVLSYLENEDVKFVDCRFVDLPGKMQHVTIPTGNFGRRAFEDGMMFDGSSVRGFQEIQESDMLLIPDPNTAVIDPFRQHKTLNINCFVKDPVTGESYSRDPRYIAQKAENYLRSTGIADTAFFGPEAEFFIFDQVRFGQDQRSAMYSVDSIEGAWNTTGETNPDGSLNRIAAFPSGDGPQTVSLSPDGRFLAVANGNL